MATTPVNPRAQAVALAFGNLPNGGAFTPATKVDVSAGKRARLFIAMTQGNGVGAYVLMRTSHWLADGVTQYYDTLRDLAALTPAAGGVYGLLRVYLDRLEMPGAGLSIGLNSWVETAGTGFLSVELAEINQGGTPTQAGVIVVPQYDGPG